MSENNEKPKSLSEKWRETSLELKKVHWPTRKQLINYTIVTIFVILFFSIGFYLIDSLLGFIVTKLVAM